ncbi:MAG: T9SS type A sorting domain-containing protein [Bacteroidales bacterium]|nr:T9SS type A sorting domain-containing protein [Bacteroidales bacterium]
MKKFTAFFMVIFLAGIVHAQDCADLIISEYVEGWYNNKALEIYNPTQNEIIFTDNYRLIRWSNGSTIADQDIQYVLPLVGTIGAYKTVVLIQDTNFAGQDSMIWAGLRAKGTYMAPADYEAGTQGCKVVFWNGDDAVSLQHKIGGNWVDIDIFAEIGVRPLNWQGNPDGGAWTDTPPYWQGQGNYLTRDQSLVRKKSIKKGIDRIAMSNYGSTSTGGFPNSFYALAEYDSLPANTFDSLGSHTCDCKILTIREINQNFPIRVYPNPVVNGKFFVRSSEPLISLEVFNLLGQPVFSKEMYPGETEIFVDLEELVSGRIFILKAKNKKQQTTTGKVVIH